LEQGWVGAWGQKWGVASELEWGRCLEAQWGLVPGCRSELETGGGSARRWGKGLGLVLASAQAKGVAWGTSLGKEKEPRSVRRWAEKSVRRWARSWDFV